MSNAASRWRRICLALAEVMWKLLSSLSAYFGDNISYPTLCSYLSSAGWRIFVRLQLLLFTLLHTIFLRPLRDGIFVRICALKHIINNPACSKWMTRPSVAVISWTSTSLPAKLQTGVNSWIIEGVHAFHHVLNIERMKRKSVFRICSCLNCDHEVSIGMISVFCKWCLICSKKDKFSSSSPHGRPWTACSWWSGRCFQKGVI